jgi:photosystem II stability/assembly factor-like uncharacterized protein
MRRAAFVGAVLWFIASGCRDESFRWTDPTPPPAYSQQWLAPTQLHSVFALDAGHAFACGASGTLWETHDLGTTWFVKPTHDPHYLQKIVFHGERGFVVGDGGTLLVSDDQGRRWQPISPALSPKNDLFSIAFSSAGAGWIVGSRGVMYQSSNGGKDWTLHADLVVADRHLHDIAFFDASRAVVVGLRGFLARTEDGGTTWKQIPTPTRYDLYSIAVAGTDAWVVGERGVVLHSSDAGKTWVPEDTSTDAHLYSVIAVPAQSSVRVIASGYRGVIVAREGAGWHSLPALSTEAYFGAAAVGRDVVLVGNASTVARSGDGGGSWRLGSQPWHPSLFGVAAVAAGAQKAGTPDSEFGALAVGRRIIQKTLDGGGIWNPVALPASVLRRVLQVGETSYFAIGDDGQLYGSTDRAETWSAEPLPGGYALTGIAALTPDDLWFTASDGSLLHRTARGVAGRVLKASEPLTDLCFDSRREGWAVEGRTSKLLHVQITSSRTEEILVSDLGDATITALYCTKDRPDLWIGASDGTLAVTVNGGKTWRPIRVAHRLIEAFDLRGDHGWAVGDRGMVLETDNGGTSWRQIDADTSSDLLSVRILDDARAVAVGTEGVSLALPQGESREVSAAFKDVTYSGPQHVWILAEGGLLLESMDGGRTFVPHALPSKELAVEIWFSDERIGWVGTKTGNVLRTSDGGLTWHAIAALPATAEISGEPGQDGWLVGAGVIARLSRDAETAEKIDLPPDYTGNAAWNSVSFASATHGYVIDTAGHILETIDGGKHWAVQATTTPLEGFFNKLYFMDSTRGFALGNHGALYATTNGGAIWTKLEIGTADALWDVHFTGACCGSVLGLKGNIFSTTDGGASWTLTRISPTADSDVGSWAFARSRSSTPEGVIVGDASLVLRTSAPDFAPSVAQFEARTDQNEIILSFKIADEDPQDVDVRAIEFQKWNRGSWIAIEGTRERKGEVVTLSWNPSAKPYDVPSGTELRYRITMFDHATAWQTVIPKTQVYQRWWDRQSSLIKGILTTLAGLALYGLVFSMLLLCWPVAVVHGARLLALLEPKGAMAGLLFTPARAALLAALGTWVATTARVRRAWSVRLTDALDSQQGAAGPHVLDALRSLPEFVRRSYLRDREIVDLIALSLQPHARASFEANEPVSRRGIYVPADVAIPAVAEPEAIDLAKARELLAGTSRLQCNGAGGSGKSTLIFAIARWAMAAPEIRIWPRPLCAILVERDSAAIQLEITQAIDRWLDAPAATELVLGEVRSALLHNGNLLLVCDGVSEWSATALADLLSCGKAYRRTHILCSSRKPIELEDAPSWRNIGCNISTVVRLIEQYSTHRDHGDSRAYVLDVLATAQRVFDIVTRLDRSRVNPLIVRMIVESAISHGPGSVSIGDVMMEYITTICRGAKPAVVSDVARRLGLLALADTYTPHTFRTAEALDALAAAQLAQGPDVVEALVIAGTLRRQLIHGVEVLRFEWDPLAEHLAAMELLDKRADQVRWQAFFEALARLPGYPEAVRGLLDAFDDAGFDLAAAVTAFLASRAAAAPAAREAS